MADQGATGRQGGDWDRLQQEFLAHWPGASEAANFAPWRELAESFSRMAAAGANTCSADAPPWQSFKALSDLLAAQAAQLRAGRKRKVDVAAAMKALLENLVRNIDVLIAAQAMAAGDKAMGIASLGLERGFADWPALGLTREWQLRLQRAWHALAAEREAGAHLRTLQWRALRAGCERCARSLAAPGPAITSLRGLYDLFVDSVEAAWHETAMTDEYSRAFGASVNAALSLRVAVRELMQPLAGVLELAGRAELDAIDRRLRELEARVIAPQSEIAAAPRAASAPPRSASRAARRASPTKRTTKAAPRRTDFDIASVIGRDDAE